MNRFRSVVTLTILVLLPVLQACGAAPAPATVSTPVGQTPAAPDGTQAVVPSTGGAIARNPSSSSPIAISDDDS